MGLSSNPHVLTAAGVLPLTKGPVRFAVGPPDGLTSNSWKLWTRKTGDVYLACRDNLQEVKVSLHTSGRWRVGFTSEAVSKNASLLQDGENRAWDVWDEPPAALPGVVTAFRLPFLTSELVVHPDQRKDWKGIAFIEAAPPGKATVLTLFVTTGSVGLKHESEPSFCLASLDIGNGRRAQLVAHGEREDWIRQVVVPSLAIARQRAAEKLAEIPEDAFVYFLGRQDDGCRFIVGARL